MPAEIRKYSPPKDNPLPVAYVIAKCHIPASARVGPIILDPASRSIEKTLFEFGIPWSSRSAPQQGPERCSDLLNQGQRLRPRCEDVNTLCTSLRFCSYSPILTTVKIKPRTSGKTSHNAAIEMNKGSGLRGRLLLVYERFLSPLSRIRTCDSTEHRVGDAPTASLVTHL